MANNNMNNNVVAQVLDILSKNAEAQADNAKSLNALIMLTRLGMTQTESVTMTTTPAVMPQHEKPQMPQYDYVAEQFVGYAPQAKKEAPKANLNIHSDKEYDFKSLPGRVRELMEAGVEASKITIFFHHAEVEKDAQHMKSIQAFCERYGFRFYEVGAKKRAAAAAKAGKAEAKTEERKGMRYEQSFKVTLKDANACQSLLTDVIAAVNNGKNVINITLTRVDGDDGFRTTLDAGIQRIYKSTKGLVEINVADAKAAKKQPKQAKEEGAEQKAPKSEAAKPAAEGQY